MDDKPKRTPTGDYLIGFAAPPKKYRWQKGTCGYPKGRPKDKKQLESEQIDALLNSPIPVMINGRLVKLSPFEIELRQLVKKALQDKDPKSCERLVKIFKRHGLLPAAPKDERGGVITLQNDKTIPFGMSRLLIMTYGAAPWSAEEIEAIQPDYERTQAEFWANKKEALRGIYLGRKRGLK